MAAMLLFHLLTRLPEKQIGADGRAQHCHQCHGMLAIKHKCGDQSTKHSL